MFDSGTHSNSVELRSNGLHWRSYKCVVCVQYISACVVMVIYTDKLQAIYGNVFLSSYRIFSVDRQWQLFGIT